MARTRERRRAVREALWTFSISPSCSDDVLELIPVQKTPIPAQKPPVKPTYQPELPAPPASKPPSPPSRAQERVAEITEADLAAMAVTESDLRAAAAFTEADLKTIGFIEDAPFPQPGGGPKASTSVQPRPTSGTKPAKAGFDVEALIG
jgi:hypothetical protein